MKPDFPIFKPVYPLRVRLAMWFPALLFFGMLCNVGFSLIRFPLVFWVLAIAVGMITSLVPFYFIREVRFPNEMVVRRHFLPDRFFSHHEFDQINADSIQAGGECIRIGTITNLDELKEMTQRWKANKLLKETKGVPSKAESPYLQRGYGGYASFWGLMFGIIVMLMDLPWLSLDPRWVLGGTFLLVYLVYIYIIPRFF